MKFIVTKKNADGTFDEVGMSNRVLLDEKKTALITAKQWFNQGFNVRIQGWLNNNFYKPNAKPSYLEFF